MKKIFSNWTTIKQSLKKRPDNKKGFSIIEVLIGAAIILTNLGVLSSALIQYGEVSKKQQVITMAMNVEAAIHRAVANPSSYDYAPGGTIDTMVAPLVGDFPVTFALAVPIDTSSGTSTITFDWNGFPTTDTLTRYLKRDMTLCAAASFTDPLCVIKVELAKRHIVASSPTYAFAYRVSINPGLQIKVMNLGVNGDAPFVDPPVLPTDPSDFNLYIPQYVLISYNTTPCNPANTAGVTGYDRNTGQAICLEQPTAAMDCALGDDATETPAAFAKGIIVEPAPAPNYRLRTRCVNSRIITCPPDNVDNIGTEVEYSLQVFDPQTLDPAAANTNQCVFTTLNPSNFLQSYPGVHDVSANSACPLAYDIDVANTSCTEQVAPSAINGMCNRCTGNSPIPPYDCNAWAPHFFPGTSYSFSGMSVAGNVVSCQFNDTTADQLPGPCAVAGSTIGYPPRWQGTIQLGIQCVLKAVNNETRLAGSL